MQSSHFTSVQKSKYPWIFDKVPRVQESTPFALEIACENPSIQYWTMRIWACVKCSSRANIWHMPFGNWAGALSGRAINTFSQNFPFLVSCSMLGCVRWTATCSNFSIETCAVWSPFSLPVLVAHWRHIQFSIKIIQSCRLFIFQKNCIWHLQKKGSHAKMKPKRVEENCIDIAHSGNKSMLKYLSLSLSKQHFAIHILYPLTCKYNVL